MRIDQINGTHGFDSAFESAQDFDRIFARGADAHRQVIGVHAAGGGVLFVLEEFDHLLALFRTHFLQDVGGSLGGQIGQEVGGSVGIHLFDDVSGAVGVERLDNCLLHLGVDFFERFGGNVFVEGLENRFAFVGSKVFYDVGNIGRVQAGQAFVGDFQFHAASWIGF